MCPFNFTFYSMIYHVSFILFLFFIWLFHERFLNKKPELVLLTELGREITYTSELIDI